MDVYVEDAAGARRLPASRFPLSIGGAGADIRLSEEASSPAAYLGISGDEVFIQPANGRVSVNGAVVAASQWLRAGDQLRISSSRIFVESHDGSLKLVVKHAGPTARPDGAAPEVGSVASDDAGLSARKGKATSIRPIQFEPRSLDELRRNRPVRGLRSIAFVAILAALSLSAWWLFTSRAVTIVIEPAADRLSLEGGFVHPKVAGKFLLRPGRYHLVAEKEGYRELAEDIEVTEESSPRFAFRLERLPGLLAVSTRPDEGATVFVDDEEMGVTPLPPIELPPGEHRVTVRAERYREFGTTVAIQGEGTRVDLEADLEPLFAAVTFLSEPAGARVNLLGKSYGPTPVAVELPEGTHEYEVLLPGRKPERGRVRVKGGEPKTVRVGDLALVDGILKLLSIPGEAQVTLDGVYRGQTPIELPLSPNAGHRLELSRAGYRSHAEDVELDSGDTETKTVELEPILGEIAIVADPPDAMLLVDGEERGPARQSLRLAAVRHRIEIRKEGYESFATDITPRPDFPQTIEATLVNLEAKKKAAALPKRITTAQGQDLVLVAPRRFEMGAPRREPGRRANEGIRQVEITRPFYMGVMEITNRQFREFRKEHRSGAVSSQSLETDHHPVVRVTWEEAAEYCNWLSAQESLPPAYVASGSTYVLTNPQTTGYRLPTEAEWALAARYATGESTKYAWGDSLPIPRGAGNFADQSAEGLVPTTVPNYDDSFAATAPADSFGQNALGIYNLGGNVAEWVQDHYALSPSQGTGVEKDPLGPNQGEFHVIRGASYLSGNITQLRLSYRDYGKTARPDVGFRIARWTR